MSVTCELCFHHCRLEEGQTGFCRARGCRNGVNQSLNYGKITSLALDPIEKKPLRRFHPGSMILSVGSFGCNLRCPFCQNHEISMVGEDEAHTITLTPEQLADMASERIPQGNIGIAYTYNEPFIGYEYVRECAELVHKRGMFRAYPQIKRPANKSQALNCRRKEKTSRRKKGSANKAAGRHFFETAAGHLA